MVLTETVEYASTVPIARAWTGMLFRIAEPIVTGTPFGGRAEGGFPPGEQPRRRDAKSREESTPRVPDGDCFREGGPSRVPRASIVFPLLEGDVPVLLPGQVY
jgi:hypothetical protein